MALFLPKKLEGGLCTGTGGLLALLVLLGNHLSVLPSFLEIGFSSTAGELCSLGLMTGTGSLALGEPVSSDLNSLGLELGPGDTFRGSALDLEADRGSLVVALGTGELTGSVVAWSVSSSNIGMSGKLGLVEGTGLEGGE